MSYYNDIYNEWEAAGRPTRFKTFVNYEMEIPFQSDLASDTVPDQSLTIREIITKYVRDGVPPAGNSSLAYTGDQPTVNIKTLDLTQIHDLQLQVQERINELENKFQNNAQREPEAGGTQQSANKDGGRGTRTTDEEARAATPAEGDPTSGKIQELINLLTNK